MFWEIQWLQHQELRDHQGSFERHWFSFNKLWRNPNSHPFLFLQENSKGLPVLRLPCAVSAQGNLIHPKKKKCWCKLNNKTYHSLQCSISNLHISADAPRKSPWHRPHKHREQQTAPAGVCMKPCSWRDFQKQLHCHTFDLFPNQKHVGGLFCCIFFFFLSQSIPQPQMHFTEFLPCMFFSCHEVFATWQARLNIFHSCLYTNYLWESSIRQVISHGSEF